MTKFNLSPLQRSFLKIVALTIYYLGIIVTLLWMELAGTFTTPAFIYQGF